MQPTSSGHPYVCHRNESASAAEAQAFSRSDYQDLAGVTVATAIFHWHGGGGGGGGGASTRAARRVDRPHPRSAT